ncbi:MAG: protoglobin domain-containing protein [Pirellulales bacterium]
MDTQAAFRRYVDLQTYVGWSDDEQRLTATAWKLIAPHAEVLIADFYEEIERHAATRNVLTGGGAQIAKLKQTLREWLGQLFEDPHSLAYVERRRRVGLRHVQIGLPQIYTHAALARLRNGILRTLCENWAGDHQSLVRVVQAVNKLLDLDLAIIGDAYESERLSRLQQSERERSDAVFRDLVEAAGCMIVILRGSGEIAYFNSYAEQLTGHAAAEMTNRNFVELIVADADRPAQRNALAEALRGEYIRGFENDVLCRDGSRRTMLWNVRRLDTYEAAPVVLAVGQDITKIKTAQHQALQAERLATIGQMSTGLAHESRNALQRIQASAEMLELEVEGNPEAMKLLRGIQHAQDHMHRLFDEVRGYAGAIALDRSPCRVADVWREAWELLATQRQDRAVELRQCPSCGDIRLSIDRFRMMQVFRNLLENALAACDDPACIEIDCKLDAAIDLANSDNPRRAHRHGWRITFRDNGPGMNAEQRKRAFEPFFTTKPKGTGLGMSIAQRIVEAHGGRIEIGESNAAGTEILIHLPLDE